MSRLLSAACGRAGASFVCLALWSALAALPVEPLAARTHSQNVIPGAPSGIQGQPEKNKRTETSPPAAAMLAADKGKFRILLDGQPVGSEEFEISPEGGQWVARGSTQIRLPAGGKGGDAGPSSVQVSGRLKLAADGAPLHYEWSTQAQKKASATVDFQGGTARIELLLEGAKPFVQELSFGTPRVLILDNNLYHHYAVLARLYDWNTRGAQTFPVLIPQDMTPGSLTVESMGPQDVQGARLDLLRVRTADIEVNLYLDANHRLVRLAVPASKAEIVRE